LLTKTHEIHEESWRVMQRMFEDMHLKLSQEHQARFANFEKEISERGRYQTAALLDKIDLEAESRLAARLDHVLDKAQEAERQSVRSLEGKNCCKPSESSRTNEYRDARIRAAEDGQPGGD
jgi:hypothetical protein